MGLGSFTDAQCLAISEIVAKVLDIQEKDPSYLMDVMLPEVVVRFIQEDHHFTYDEANAEMMRPRISLNHEVLAKRNLSQGRY